LCSTPVATSAMPAERDASSTRRRVCSSSSFIVCWAVTSFEIPKVPITVPSASRSGSLLLSAQVSRSSCQRRRSSLPTTASPVAMMRSSSRRARRACSSAKKSASDLPTNSSGATPWRRALEVLTAMNRLSRSLK